MSGKPTLHVQGMGALGSLTAWELHSRGARFTWDDIEDPFVAWPASAGGVLPIAGDPSYLGWSEMFSQQPWGKHINCMEEAEWWFNHKHPPHNGGYDIVEDIGALRLGALPSYVLNVGELVRRTRDFFKAQRRATQTEGTRLVVAHGFHSDLPGCLWGWTRLVRVKFRGWEGHGPRPHLYLRKGRFVMCYLIPLPYTPWWCAGTAMILQKRGKERLLEVEPKFSKWVAHLQQLTDGKVKLTGLGEMRQGWRPYGGSPQLKIYDGGQRIQLPCTGADGVRSWPVVLEKLRAVLG